MARYGKKELSPFDVRNDIPKKEVKERFSPFARKNLALTTRSSVFMLGFILTMALLIASFGRMLVPLALAYAIVVFWTITFRFIENCRTIPVNILLNVLLVVGVYLLPRVAPDPGSFYCYMPLIVGLTALGSSIRDGRAYYMRSYVIEEIVLPVTVGSACVLTASVACKFLFESKNVGVMLIISAVVLGAISLVISKIWDKEVLMSAGKLADVSDYSPVNLEANTRFFMERGVFLLESVVIMIILTVLRLVSIRYIPDLPFVVYPAVAALTAMVFAFASGRRWDDKFACESLIAVTVIPLMAPITGIAVCLGVDVLVMGYLHTYKKQKMSADVPKSFDGLPILTAALGFILMAIEAVFK